VNRMIICTALALSGSLLGCDEGSTDTAATQSTQAEEPSAPVAEAPPGALPAAHPAPGTAGGQGAIRGTVSETMNSAGYTYLLIDTERGAVWAAASEMTVAVGDQVEVAGGSMMSNFTSRTLDRTFDQILFTSHALVLGAEGEGAAPAAAPGTGGEPPLPEGHPPLPPPVLPPGHP